LHSNSLGSYAVDIAFFNSRAKFEFLKDPDIISWIEKGMVGAMTFCNARFASSELHPFTVTHDNSRNRVFEMDINNFYGSMCTIDMPYSDYEWLDLEELHKCQQNEFRGDDGWGFI